MSSLRWEVRSSRQSRRHRSSRSSLRWQRTRWAAAWSPVWCDPAATLPACRLSLPILPASDSNSCARWCPVFAGWRSWLMLAIPPPCSRWLEVQATTRTLGLDVVTLEIRRAEDIAPAFEALKGRAEALYVCAESLVTTNRVRINTLALAARLPTMHSIREYVEAGGLMSYGPNFPDLWRRAGDLVDKILRGAKPADIPV